MGRNKKNVSGVIVPHVKKIKTTWRKSVTVKEDCSEVLASGCVAPVDISRLQAKYPDKKIIPHFQYDEYEFRKGEKLQTLPEADAKFNDKKYLAHKLSDTYSEILDTESDEKLYKRWGQRMNKTARCADLVKSKGDVIYQTLFCKTRLCPMCSWRREIKISIQTREILSEILKQEKKKYRYLFLTLTVVNVWNTDLIPGQPTNVFDRMLGAWHKMTNGKTVLSRWFNSFVVGWYRGLEITRNTDKCKVYYIKDQKTGKKKKVLFRDSEGQPVPNPWYLSWHPHFHNILIVPEDCPYDLKDLEHKFLKAWQECYGDERITQVNLKEFAPNPKIMQDKELQKKFSATELEAMAIVSAVVEGAKYTVKSSDYILDADATRLLDFALERRRLVAYGGLMKDYHNMLHLDDPIDGDLLCNNATQIDKDAPERTYAFSVGFKQYIRIDNRKLKK